MPDPADLPPLPTFTVSGAANSGLDLLAVAASTATSNPCLPAAALTTAGPYNPAASLPPKVVKKVLDLEFVEMTELRADIWVDEPQAPEVGGPMRRPPSKPPVTDIKVWLECYARMAALLVSRYPYKGPELWAYQSTILRAAQKYEGANWVAYDRQYRRDMLARKDLNWSTPNARLFNEAFTGRAKAVPRCPHCLCEDHAAHQCPHNPQPLVLGWYPDPRQGIAQLATAVVQQPRALASRTEVCRNYNMGRCRYSRCRYQHMCSECSGPHPVVSCPRGSSDGMPYRGRPATTTPRWQPPAAGQAHR